MSEVGEILELPITLGVGRFGAVEIYLGTSERGVF
jgi:hypothetical protein